MMVSKAALTLMVLACACSEPGLLSPDELSALARAEAQWKARPFANYRFEIQQSCFCPPELGRWTRVSIQNGRVIEARTVETDAAVPAENLVWWTPIDSLFSRLRRAAGDAEVRNTYRDILTEFDPALGFPTRIEWQAKPTVQDGGVIYSLRNVRPLE